ncbi:MAG TPA: questin oxidase family protein, partial [Usitatibacter sp.]|nr:questin oxidase family protein [Usitatibacter sp.]
MSASAAASRRIAAAHRYGAIYRGGLASHHPMAITALDAMGASEADMDAFEARYLPQLEAMPSAVVTIQDGDEAAHLGSTRAFPEWLVYFQSAIAREGGDTVLRRWVDRLIPAVASGAFHGAIRTAFAIESGAREELAHGLAYWASSYATLPMPGEPSGSRSPYEALAAIAADPALAGKRLPGNGIISRAVAAAKLPQFAACVSSLDP